MLASTIKVVHLLAYATAVIGGLDPEEPVRVGDWDAFHPFEGDGPIGAGAHHRALTSLGIDCDEYGVAHDPEQARPARRDRHGDDLRERQRGPRLPREPGSATTRCGPPRRRRLARRRTSAGSAAKPSARSSPANRTSPARFTGDPAFRRERPRARPGRADPGRSRVGLDTGDRARHRRAALRLPPPPGHRGHTRRRARTPETRRRRAVQGWRSAAQPGLRPVRGRGDHRDVVHRNGLPRRPARRPRPGDPRRSPRFRAGPGRAAGTGWATIDACEY